MPPSPSSLASRSPLPREQLFEFRGEHYGFLGVRLADFVPAARPLSDSWDTVAMPVGLFRRAARPFEELIHAPAAAATPWFNQFPAGHPHAQAPVAAPAIQTPAPAPTTLPASYQTSSGYYAPATGSYQVPSYWYGR